MIIEFDDAMGMWAVILLCEDRLLSYFYNKQDAETYVNMLINNGE